MCDGGVDMIDELINDYCILADDGAVIFASYDHVLEFVDKIRAEERERRTLAELLDSTPECEVVAVSENGIRTLMQALRCTAPVGEHEPIGFFSINDYGNWEENESGYGTPLYTAPPKKEWVGLTDDDKQEAFDETQEASGGFWEFADYLEAKLKEKNCG